MKKTFFLLWLFPLFTSCTTLEGVSAYGPLDATKEGRARSIRVLGAVINRDASVKTAAMNGGIEVVHTVDREVTNLAGLVVIYTTVVRGR